VVDGVLPEPDGGTGNAPLDSADQLANALVQGLQELDGLTAAELVAHRRDRFRRYGAPTR
jgi:acetyl-CoA carboxylase alpha subunit